MDQEQIIKEQDDQLEEIEQSVKKIKENAKMINTAIDDQKTIIKEMGEGMDKTEEKMGFAMKKLSTLLQTQNKGQIKLFLTLLCVSIVMFLVLILA